MFRTHTDNMPLTGKEIRRVTRTTINVLKHFGIEAYLVGSAACAIYGMKKREPNDIDVVVITSHNTETIKRLLETSSSHFSTVPSTNPSNTYRVLWYSTATSSSTSRPFRCKVDILAPGVLGIPVIPTTRIVNLKRYQDIPVGPFLEVLLLKLKAWSDHSADFRRYMRAKITVDVVDIDELLKLAIGVYGTHLEKETWMPDWFIENAKAHVKQYTTAHPLTKGYWKALGF